MTRSTYLAFFLSLAAVTTLPALPELLPGWKTATGGKIIGNGDAWGADVAFLSEDNYLYYVDARSGYVADKLKTRTKIRSGPYKSRDGNSIIEHQTGPVCMYNRRGEVVIEYPIPGPLKGAPAIDDRGIIYFCTENGYLLSYTHCGRHRWTIRLGKKSFSNPVITGGTKLSVIIDNNFYLITDTGRITPFPVPYDLKECKGLFSSGREGLLLLFPEYLLKGDTTGKVLKRADFPLYFTAAGGISAGGGTFCFYSRDGFLVWYDDVREDERTAASPGRTGESGELRNIFSVRLLLEGNLRGCALQEHYLAAGGDDWVLYGYELPRSLSADPVREGAGNGTSRDYGRDADNTSSFLSYLASSQNREDLLYFLAEVEEMLMEKRIDGDDLYILRLLEKITEGTENARSMGVKKYDTIADIRSKAAVLMGKLGNLRTQKRLVELLRREYHPDVRKAIIHALGLLRSDPEKNGLRIVGELSEENNTLKRDGSLVSEILFFLEVTKQYHGRQTEADLYSIVYPIFQGNYPRTLRKQALHLMETDK